MPAAGQNVSGPTYVCAIVHRAAVDDVEKGVPFFANSPQTWMTSTTSTGSA